MAEFAIAGRLIGPEHPPYVIAELSGNHNGDLDRALRLIDAAADAGADAVKLQTYRPDTITIDHDGPGFRLETGLWAGKRLYDLYGEAQTPWDWHEALFAHAARRGLACFSSPFDPTAVDFLNQLNAPAFKIASFEAVDLPLIARAAASGKPLVISTGMASASDIAEALSTARAHGAGGVALLHCVSEYPARIADANLRALTRLASEFGVVVGLSDHSPGITAPIAAVALGARIIEKHFTLARADGGPDAAFSLEPAELSALTAACRDAFHALGRDDLCRGAGETENKQFRRSLYVTRDVPAGEPLTEDAVRSIRPGFGLAPKHLWSVLGRMAARDLKKGEPLDWSMVA